MCCLKAGSQPAGNGGLNSGMIRSIPPEGKPDNSPGLRVDRRRRINFWVNMKKSAAAVLWNQACRHLSQVLSKDVYDRWIALIEPGTLADGVLTLEVANNFYLTWLEDNYLSLMQDAVRSVCGEDIAIRLEVNLSVPFQTPPAEPAAKKASPAPARKTLADVPLNPKYTFESFVVGSSNQFAHAAAMAVAQSPGKAYNPLFIYGGSGLGKTHLMQAIGHSVQQSGRNAVTYLACEVFLNEYIDALQRGAVVAFRKKYRNTDVLLIDDIHFLAGKERMQEEFFHTFNALFDRHKQIVLASDRPANEIPGLEHRLVSRFEWGLVTDLETPDMETRIAILRKKQELFNISLPPEVLSYIAQRVRSNIRRLEGALIRAASYSSLTGKELTLDNLERLLRSVLDEEAQDTLSMEAIQRTVAEYYKISHEDMISKRRPAAIAFPRQVAMYLCRTLTDHSLPAIGNAFGRNHATVLHACRLLTEKIQSDPDIRQTVSILNDQLENKG